MDRRDSTSKDAVPRRPPHDHDNDNANNVYADEFEDNDDDFMPSVSDGFRSGPMMGGGGMGGGASMMMGGGPMMGGNSMMMGGGMGMGSGLGMDLDNDFNDDNDDLYSARQDHDRPEPPRPPITNNAPPMPTKTADNTDLRRVATRNSTAKVPFPRELSTADHRRISSGINFQRAHNPRDSVSSTASFATMARSDDTPLGTGPSHPYGMYPQNTLVRSASIATTSTSRAPQSPVAMQRPAHPYGMYQNVVVEDEPPLPMSQLQVQVQNAIPLGFPGINTAVAAGYHRQIGPDGEEQDIVGPDGHTEQLPPYSRYPEEGPTKASLAAEASAVPLEAAVPNQRAESNDALLAHVASTIPSTPPSPTSPVTPVPVIPPTSVAPALLPQQRPETQTGSTAAPRPATTSESASLLTSSDESTYNEKLDRPESTKKVPWRKRRLWGRVPVTVALVLLILLLIFALILGAAIGTFVAKQNKKDSTSDKDTNSKNKHDDPLSAVLPTNTLFDATPIATPTGLASLPFGNFSLPLGYAQESSPGCLTQGNQYSAWSCKMSFAPLMLTVSSLGPNAQSKASLGSFASPDGSIPYGLQAPVVSGQPLQLVSDLDYKGFGPAWHFSTRYDKVVVLSPDEFAAGASLKRQDKLYRHRFQIMPGDSPWLCYWNQTYIEGYIYVMDNSTTATVSGYPTPNPTDPFGPMQFGSSSSSVSGASSVPSATATSSASSKHRRDDTFPRLPPYPRIVKIEERRLPGAPQPYCKKMQFLDNGKLVPATGSNGGYILVWLQEQDPSLDDFHKANTTSDRRKRHVARHVSKRGDPSDACHCQWMFQ